MTARTLCGALGAAVLVAWTAFPAAAEMDALTQAGHASYVRYCASCHGVEGTGKGPLHEDLRLAPSDLTTIAARRDGVFPSPLIAEIIDGRRRVRAHGPREMPVWGHRIDLDVAGTAGTGTETAIRGEILLLIEYLKYIQVPKL